MQKKKKPAGEDTGAEQTAADTAGRRAADKRFNESVNALASNSEDTLWIRLDNTHVTDAKSQRLCEALKKNTHALSLDLSANDLSDAGVSALCAVLSSGAAPDLIELRLMDNKIGPKGMEAIKELGKARKTLKVETGTTLKLSSSGHGTGPGGGAKSQNPASTNSSGGASGGSNSLGDSAIIRKYFQVGNDDEDEDEDDSQDIGVDTSGGEREGATGLDPEQLSALLWDKVRTQTTVLNT